MRPVSVEIDSPAKVNLGLELLGKRPDGYHEIRTIMVGLALCDELRLWPTPRGEHPTGTDLPGVPCGANLINRSLVDLAQKRQIQVPSSWSLTKRIPAAAGLGGGSSNAAAALIAGNRLADAPVPIERLHHIAAGVGSDVPFFLGKLCASVEGRGDQVHQITEPVVEEAAVLILPDVQIPNKTATLYGQVMRVDFSDGGMVGNTVASLESGLPVQRHHLRNAFARPLYDLVPELAKISVTLDALGFERHGLSGAGPVHYVLLGGDDPRVAEAAIRSALPDTWTIRSTMTRVQPLSPVVRCCA